MIELSKRFSCGAWRPTCYGSWTSRRYRVEVHGGASELTDGMWMAGFEDHSPDTRFPGFEIGIEQDWSPEQAVRELRLELRNKLWICPLCQRRSQIRRIIDREVFRVECDRCGRFEIENGLLDHFRLAYEDNDESLVEQRCRGCRSSSARAGRYARFCPLTTGVTLATSTIPRSPCPFRSSEADLAVGLVAEGFDC